MGNINSIAMSDSIDRSKRKWGGRIIKFSIFGALSLIAIFSMAHWVWLMSGSNQWELERDENGVKVYSLKTPGSSFKIFKGVTKIKASLGSFVKQAQDPDSCYYCAEARVIEEESSQLVYSYVRVGSHFPFRPRDKVMMSRFSQNPETKELFVEVFAAPSKVPRNECCVRVTHKHNTWRLTPLGNGEVEIEFVLDEDLGGYMPSYITNSSFPDNVYLFLSYMEKILSQEKYQNAKFDFLEEP